MFNALRHTDTIRTRETKTWNDTDVAAVVGHRPEVTAARISVSSVA